KRNPDASKCVSQMGSSSLDLDLLRGLLRLKLLGKRQREYAFLEARFNFIRIDAFRHLEAALEGAKVALMHIIILLLLLFFFLLLTLDDQVAIGDLHFDVLLIHPGQFGRELVGLLAFGDVYCWGSFPSYFAAPKRLDIEY